MKSSFPFVERKKCNEAEKWNLDLIRKSVLQKSEKLPADFPEEEKTEKCSMAYKTRIRSAVNRIRYFLMCFMSGCSCSGNYEKYMPGKRNL